MKPSIKSVHRASPHSFRVVFSCGHRHTITRFAFSEKQWYIGKPIECLHCVTAEKKA